MYKLNHETSKVIRAVVVVMLIMLMLSIADNQTEEVFVSADMTAITKLTASDATVQEQLIRDAREYRTLTSLLLEASVEKHFEPVISTPAYTVLELPEIVYKNKSGVKVTSQLTVISSDLLWAAYSDVDDLPFGDNNSLVNSLWNGLVVQNNIDPVIASAVIGNIMEEGVYGQKYSSKKTFQNIDQAYDGCINGDVAIGCVQWLDPARRKLLWQYYEYINNQINQDGEHFQLVKITAEICCLIEELNNYTNIFSSYERCGYDSIDNKIQSAVGLIGRQYEIYDTCYDDWARDGNSYWFKGTQESSGWKRLQNARKVYDYYVTE